MSNETSQLVTRACEAESDRGPGQSSPVNIELEFGEAVGDHVNVCTRLRIEHRTLEALHTHYGMDILNFADSLVGLRDRMEGTARLLDWDENVVLCLTVIDSGRGRVAIGGQLVPAIFWTKVASQDNLLNPRLLDDQGGIRIAFEGLVADQSYLSPMIAGLRLFLAESRISIRNPMLGPFDNPSI